MNFDIDGLHFDYIRFTGSNQGYNPTRPRYNASSDSGQPLSSSEQFTMAARPGSARPQGLREHPVCGRRCNFRGGQPGTRRLRAPPARSEHAALLHDVLMDAWVPRH